MVKLTKEKACEILEVEVDADETTVKSAYRKLAMKWHPDKNPDNEEEAKVMFQRVHASYTRLTTEYSDEEFEMAFDSDDEEEAMAFFAFIFMNSEFGGRRGGRGGFPFRMPPFFGAGGGPRAPPPPSNFSSFFGGGGGGYDGGYYDDDDRSYTSRTSRRNAEQEWLKQRRQAAAASARAAREAKQAQREAARESDRRWGQTDKERDAAMEKERLVRMNAIAAAFVERQLARPIMVSRTDNSVTLSLSRSLADSEQLPTGVFLELSARAASSSSWLTYECSSVVSTMSDLLPGTKYVFRVRPGCKKDDDVVWGPWSAESQYLTTGNPIPTSSAAPARAAAAQGKKSKRREAAAKKGGAQQQQAAPEMDAEAEMERLQEEKAKENAMKAAIEKAAKEYEEEAARIAQLVKQAPTGAAKKKKGKTMVVRPTDPEEEQDEEETKPYQADYNDLSKDPFGGVAPDDWAGPSSAPAGNPYRTAPGTGQSAKPAGVTINGRVSHARYGPASRSGPPRYGAPEPARPQHAYSGAPEWATGVDDAPSARELADIEEAIQLSLALEQSRLGYEHEVSGALNGSAYVMEDAFPDLPSTTATAYPKTPNRPVTGMNGAATGYSTSASSLSANTRVPQTWDDDAEEVWSPSTALDLSEAIPRSSAPKTHTPSQPAYVAASDGSTWDAPLIDINAGLPQPRMPVSPPTAVPTRPPPAAGVPPSVRGPVGPRPTGASFPGGTPMPRRPPAPPPPAAIRHVGPGGMAPPPGLSPGARPVFAPSAAVRHPRPAVPAAIRPPSPVQPALPPAHMHVPVAQPQYAYARREAWDTATASWGADN